MTGREDGRVVAFDLGDRRIGVAVSDPLRILATGRETLQRDGDSYPWRALLAVIAEAEAVRIVVGDPLHMDGRSGERSGLARDFAKEIGERTGLPVDLEDERLTSVDGEDRLTEAGRSARSRKKGELGDHLDIGPDDEPRGRDFDIGEPAREHEGRVESEALRDVIAGLQEQGIHDCGGAEALDLTVAPTPPRQHIETIPGSIQREGEEDIDVVPVQQGLVIEADRRVLERTQLGEHGPGNREVEVEITCGAWRRQGGRRLGQLGKAVDGDQRPTRPGILGGTGCGVAQEAELHGEKRRPDHEEGIRRRRPEVRFFGVVGGSERG